MGRYDPIFALLIISSQLQPVDSRIRSYHWRMMPLFYYNINANLMTSNGTSAENIAQSEGYGMMTGSSARIGVRPSVSSG
jgi:hypothetical protein